MGLSLMALTVSKAANWRIVLIAVSVLRCALCIYGCETLSLAFREERRLRVSVNGMSRKIFGHEREKVTGGWRKLHNDGLHALYPSPDSIRAMETVMMSWAVHVARMGEKRNAYRVLVGKPDEKRPL